MNILILTGKFGMGHYSAANALAEELRDKLPRSNVFVEDFFMHTLNAYCGRLYRLFSLMVNKGKLFYNWIYRHTEDSERKVKLPLRHIFMNSLEELLDETSADVVISTVWSCSQVVSEYKQRTGRQIMLITCITDVTSHREWIQPNTDYYLAAAPKVKEDLIKKGVAPQRIIVSGIPVKSAFKTCAGQETSQGKTLLIMGGGLGLLPKSSKFYEELDELDGIKTTIITGQNKNLYHALNGRYRNITVLGFVDDVYRYMQNADLIISKPGGITLFEAIFASLPLLMFSPFLEQEMRNGNFVLENKIGVVLPQKPEDSIPEIRRILEDDSLLESIRGNMIRFRSVLDENGLQQLLLRREEQGTAV